ncbi:hypothetical protein EYR36_004074 [Pleurotus pulmonarius]|nr:hypothetical protein EYR36_004074 [Pleurotus pulmonarius]KAF4581628.1 hypothetical protein EYR38_002957 [Pleurotus pulmonarius]
MFALNFIALVVLAFLVDSNVASPNVSRRSAQACASSNVPRFNPLAVFRTPPASGSPTTPIRMIDALTIPHIGWGIFSAGGSSSWLFYNLQNGAIFPIGSNPSQRPSLCLSSPANLPCSCPPSSRLRRSRATVRRLILQAGRTS